MGQVSSNWHTLPDDILAEIANYLKPVDRYNACLVCKNWCRVITNAPVWFHRSFYLNGTELDTRAIEFAARYGHLLKAVRLDFLASRNNREVDALQDNFYDFMSNLKNDHTSLTYLSVCSSYGGALDGAILGEDLAGLLKMQYNLEVFELSIASFNIPVAVLISVLSTLNKIRLRKLILQKFHTLPGRLYSNKLYLDWLEKCSNLQLLHLRHDFINNDVLLCVSRGSQFKWKKLVVSYEKLDICDHFLSTSAWLETLESSPNLKVTYTIDAKHHEILALTNFLLREGMPLKNLIINLDVETPWEEEEHLNIISLQNQLGESLDKFFGVLENTQVNLNGEHNVNFENFFSYISTNPKVVSLDVAIPCDNEAFHNFCTAFADSTAAIERLNLFIWPVTDPLLQDLDPILKSLFEKIHSRGTVCQLYPMGIFHQEKYSQQIDSLSSEAEL